MLVFIDSGVRCLCEINVRFCCPPKQHSLPYRVITPGAALSWHQHCLGGEGGDTFHLQTRTNRKPHPPCPQDSDFDFDNEEFDEGGFDASAMSANLLSALGLDSSGAATLETEW